MSFGIHGVQVLHLALLLEQSDLSLGLFLPFFFFFFYLCLCLCFPFPALPVERKKIRKTVAN